MSERGPSDPLLRIEKSGPRITIAPNVLVHRDFVPSARHLYIFNIFPFPEADLVVIDDADMPDPDEPFARTERIRSVFAEPQTEEERIAFIEENREDLSAKNGVNAETIQVFEIDQEEASGAIQRFMNQA